MNRNGKNKTFWNRANINEIKNHTATAIERVYAITFVFFDIGYIVLNRFLRLYLPDTWWVSFLEALFVAVIYGVIYQIIKFAYNKYIVIKQSKLDIEGEWYHIHIPHDTTNRTCLSGGVTHIKRELNDFTFEASNYDFVVTNGTIAQKQNDNEPRTRWFTEASEICDGREIDIIEVYKAISDKDQMIVSNNCPLCHRSLPASKQIPEAGRSRYGIHRYKVDKTKNMIICDYSDCWPSLKSGKLYLFKNQADRDAKILEKLSDSLVHTDA